MEKERKELRLRIKMKLKQIQIGKMWDRKKQEKIENSSSDLLSFQAVGKSYVLYQFQMESVLQSQPFTIIKNYRKTMKTKITQRIKKQPKRSQKSQIEESESSSLKVHTKTRETLKKKILIAQKGNSKYDVPVLLNNLEEPKVDFIAPVDFEDDPFIEKNYFQQTPQPYKMDHQDSMMTEDQIREVNSYFTF